MGTKKDVLFLNDKSTTVENWDNILKTAGFLRGNCFVIHQGNFFYNFSREKCLLDAGNSKFQNEFMKLSFLPKYEPIIVKISDLYCATHTTGQGFLVHILGKTMTA
jgi:hypothetical protein